MMAIAGGLTVNLPIKMVQTKNTLVQVLNILRCASTIELRFNITNELTEDKTLNLMKSIYVLLYHVCNKSKQLCVRDQRTSMYCLQPSIPVHGMQQATSIHQMMYE